MLTKHGSSRNALLGIRSPLLWNSPENWVTWVGSSRKTWPIAKSSLWGPWLYPRADFISESTATLSNLVLWGTVCLLAVAGFGKFLEGRLLLPVVSAYMELQPARTSHISSLCTLPDYGVVKQNCRD
ncbi:hypothetical protein EJ05DRAFT_156098 [Pseudovirgaria hyperparasitica]|uniref:Uncharacterized protein n=1 Tax=Pseudovirgaria hyperparasitica TaxID=470096 RepID=A0A6A6VVY8_9PEZI|nr:uncharacterized protein EJ05DRAFT_156098 [Pseudovirgaria hyperparasitica]KAF2754325.1 hypothetical protein EJ05DRAFT_156098 [Pseudovirgaria hyperparasitica]